MNKRISQIDMWLLRSKSIPQRILNLERGATKNVVSGVTAPSSMSVARAGTPVPEGVRATLTSGEPIDTVNTQTIAIMPEQTYYDSTPANPSARPNLLQNGSFEFYQNGNAVPHKWNTSLTVVQPGSNVPDATVDGYYVMQITDTSSLSQEVEAVGVQPEGAWVFSIFAKNTTAAPTTIDIDCAFSPPATLQTIMREDQFGTIEATNIVPDDGEWYRFWVSAVTNQQSTLTVSVTTSDTLTVDAAKLEYVEDGVTFIEPTAFVADSFSQATIIRELRADNIVAGTLTVGGAGSANPVIVVLDTEDAVLATLGDPTGGFKGLRVFGNGGIRVEAQGTIEAGTIQIANNKLRIETVEGYTPTPTVVPNSVHWSDAQGDIRAAITGHSDGRKSELVTQVIDSNGEIAVTERTTATGYTTYGVSNPNEFASKTTTVQLAYEYPSSVVTQESKLSGAKSRLDSSVYDAAATVETEANWQTGEVVASLGIEAAFSQRRGLFVSRNSGGAVTVKADADVYDIAGASRTFPAVAGTLSQGAGQLSATTGNDVTGTNHTHAIEAFDAPGATENRLIKTGAGGVVTLAGVRTNSLQIENSSVLTHGTNQNTVTFPAVNGTSALGAGTLAVNSVNNASVTAHTHAITSSSNPGAAASLLATNAAGNVTVVGVTATNATVSNLTVGGYKASPQRLVTYAKGVTQSIPSGTTPIIVNYDTVVNNPYNSGVTTGANWGYTIQEAGIYEIEASVMFDASTGWADGEYVELAWFHQGNYAGRIDFRYFSGAASKNAFAAGKTTTFTVSAGEVLNVRVAQTSGAPLNILAVGAYSKISIKRVF